MTCIILFRWDNGKLAAIAGEDEPGDPHEFSDADDAIAFVDRSQLLLGRDVQIVELDEI